MLAILKGYLVINLLIGENMKVKFLKQIMEFICYCLVILGSLCLIIIGIVFFSNLGVLILVALLFLIYPVYMLFIDKRPSSIVIYSEEGIEWKSFKKSIEFIRWDEITEITETRRGQNFYWLTFMTKERRIDVELTKKMYDTIMILCPYQNLKNRIDDLENFKGLHRKKK